MQRDVWASRHIRKRRWLQPWALFSGVFMATVGIGTAYSQGWIGAAGEGLAADVPTQLPATMIGAAHFPAADIDAPETHDFRCPEEKILGDRATARLRELLQVGTLTLGLSGRDYDQYGRKLRIVMVDGTSVGEALVREGLARRYGGGRRPWCGTKVAQSTGIMFD